MSPFLEIRNLKKKSDVEKHDKKIQSARMNKSRRRKKEIIWFGTSQSQFLDCNKFERDTRTALKMVNVDSIKSSSRKSLHETVKREIKTDNPDYIIIEAGTEEITLIDAKSVNKHDEKALMKFKRELHMKVENDSKKIFQIAEEASELVKDLHVIIVKRLPRYDDVKADPLKLKANLSHFANSVFDQLWFKKGSPTNIHIVNIELGTESSKHLKNLIYGQPTSKNYDGIHLEGEGASRHLSYRAVQAIKPIIDLRSLHQKNEANPTQSRSATERIVYSVPVKNRFMGNL